MVSELALPYEVPTLGVVAWTRKKKGANRDQHSRDQRARSGGLWSGGLDPKRGANRDQHSRDQRGCWFFKGWGIVMIPHRPKLALPFEVPTLGVVAYGVVAWTQRGVPTVTNIAVTNEDVGSSKGGVRINWYQEPAQPFEVPTLGVVAYGVVAWTQRGVPTVTNIAVTNELGVVAYGVVAWTQRGVPTVTNIAVTNELGVVAYGVVACTQRGVPTVTNIAVTTLGVVAYGVVAWTQRGVPTVTNIAVVAYGVVAWTQRGVPTVINEDVGSSKGGVLL
ncbi:hypothetical protein Tco_0962691 [Tanacetum coccineum]